MLAASEIPIDEMFDLDAALTMPLHVNHQEEEVDDDDDGSKAGLLQLDEVVLTAEGGGQCAVCREGLRIGAAKRTPCDHIFHQDCISRWLSLNDSCPLCRRPIFKTTSSSVSLAT